MKESVTIALEYIKANAEKLGINPDVLANYNVHIHVPEGATPKDGPSAGVAMLTSLVSSFTQKRVKKSLAMTGEITLTGRVLPIGGLREKSLAAYRAGIRKIIIPKKNEVDLEKIPASIKAEMTFVPVTTISEVIHEAVLGES